MNKRLGAIALAACACGLLFSGAASARQAADPLTVTGAVLGPASNGTYVQFFTGNGPLMKQMSFSGGSNFHFAGVGWAGAACQLTPANGGFSCTFSPPFPNLWVNTTISGTLPSAVTGTVVYADNSTGTFTAPITDGPPASYGYSSGVVVTGTSIQVSIGSAMPPLLQFSLYGGSNWHVTAGSTSGGSCGLTPTNGGVNCAFATAVTGFVLNATFTGPPPTRLSGQITYAHNVTLYWAWESSCRCTKTSTEFTGFKKENHGDKLVFFLKWKLHCTGGPRAGSCMGAVNLHRPALSHDLQLRQADGKAWKGGMLHIVCNPKQVTAAGCQTTTGTKKFELVGPAAARANRRVSFPMILRCGGSGLGGTRTRENLTLTFDKHGNLDRNTSRLGGLN